MANLRILAKNIADTCDSITADPVLLTTLPPGNLILPTERNRVARTSALATQVITLTWPTDQRINCVGLTRHNLTTDGLVQALASQLVSPTDLYDTLGHPAFSTSGLDTDLDDYTDAEFRGLKNTILYFTDLVTNMRQLDVVLTDAANPDGYMEVTRLWAGKYFEFAYNPAFGAAELQPMDSSAMERAQDGTQIVDRGWLARKLTLNLDFISDAELKSVYAMARYLGKNGECLIDLYPTGSGANQVYNRMAARLTDSPTFNPNQYGFSRNTMTFEET